MKEDRRSSRGERPARSLTRKGTRSDKKPRVATKGPAFPEPAVCVRCGAIYSRKVWRWTRDFSDSRLELATRVTCPACAQAREGKFYGRVLLRGSFTRASETEVLARVEHVARRAAYTQPERRIVAIRRMGGGLDISTTSEKLAHRIVRELLKAFRGQASYAWSDRDGSLLATWEEATTI